MNLITFVDVDGIGSGIVRGRRYDKDENLATVLVLFDGDDANESLSDWFPVARVSGL
jgi:hypothetical protein